MGSSSKEAATRRKPQPGTRERVARPPAGTGLSQLSGSGLAIVSAGALLTVVVTVLCVALFVTNIADIMADVSYRQALNYESAAGQLVTQSSTYQEGLQAYPQAIQYYQDALNTVPGWNFPPPLDSYRLFLGKTYLEYAQALQSSNSDRSKTSQILQQMQAALQVFLQAAKDNPLIPIIRATSQSSITSGRYCRLPPIRSQSSS